MQNKNFAVDRFAGEEEGRLISISGWLISQTTEAMNIELRIDGKPYANLYRCYRHDVANKFPDIPQSVRSGFVGDLVVPESIADANSFTLTLCAIVNNVSEVLAEQNVIVRNELTPTLKVRNLKISHLLLDPNTNQIPEQVLYVAKIPHFHRPGKLPIIWLSKTGESHDYSNYAKNLIEQTKGYVLNFGSGILMEKHLRDNVINLDAIQWPYVDVVNTHKNLPFKTEIFDAVISQAVFEHVPDPFHSAREVLRVLKPGGIAMIDTAFMQPFHGDPNHYFNMTTFGLREIMHGFDIIELGIRPYQFPSYGLSMQLNTIMPFISSEKWCSTLEQLRDDILQTGSQLDESLGEVGREILAAGVYVVARKPI